MQDEFRVLQEKYPRLVPANTPFEHGPGWIGVLDRFFADVDAVVPADVPFRIAQIKEKFGTLRLYCEAMWPGKEPTGIFEVSFINSGERLLQGVGELDEKLEWAKRLAEARSAHTCEKCGGAGRLMVKNHYWYTACGEHADGGKPVEGETTFTSGGVKYRYDPSLDELVPAA